MDQSTPQLPAPGAAPSLAAPPIAPAAAPFAAPAPSAFASPATPVLQDFAPPAPSPSPAASPVPAPPAPSLASTPPALAPPVVAPALPAQPEPAATPLAQPHAPALPVVPAAPQLQAQPQAQPGLPTLDATPPATPFAAMQPVATKPAASSAPRRGLLMAGLGAITVGAVAAGAFVITRSGGDDVIVDDSLEVVRDSSTEDTAAYSFATAAAAAQRAASVTFDMDIQTPDGPMTAIASFDRASGRMAIDIDISELVIEDDFIDMEDMGDSFQIIVDEQNDVTYMSASVMGAIFGETGTDWISTDSGEFSTEDDLFGQMFTNPLGIADIFGDVEPIEIGEETINGETLRHYQVTTDEAFDDQDIVENDLSDDFADDVADDIIYDVWVSEDNQIRRMMFEVVEDDEPGSVDLWISISSDPIDIQVPDPSNVLDLDDLFESAFTETTDFDMEGGAGSATVETDGEGGVSVSVSVDGDPIEFSTEDPDQPATTEQLEATLDE